ncbi:MAG: pyruvate kinase [Zetaproteobacteria bacterium]|nr:pyruvate kinase [Zetaproteobacteria bacterium]
MIPSPAADATPIVQGMRCFTKHEVVRHCKIVGTLGPASSDVKTLAELIESGLDVARLNFSHGTHDVHLQNIENVRKIALEKGKYVAILQDLQGPKIRCGKMLNNGAQLVAGKNYILRYGTEQTDPNIIPIDYRDLVNDVKVGNSVMMDDGLLICKVVRVASTEVEVVVEVGGTLKNRKGVNFPDSVLSLPALTEKDSADLLFGIRSGVDLVALSFVQTPRDVVQCKKMIQALGADIPVVAKIERLSAIEMIDEIAAVADGLMVARGDLGVESGVEKVPIFQRKILAAAEKHAIPAIIATQMLESMIENPRPTLAEVTDVANGVLEGADCVMLSGEVAAGRYPVACIERMASIICEVESWSRNTLKRYSPHGADSDISWEEHRAIARAACEAADTLGAKAIVCLTLTGSIARLISKWRPLTPVIAMSPRTDVIQRLSIAWGVYGMKNPLFYNTDLLLQDLPDLLKNLGVVKSGDVIVMTAGIPINAMKPTNMIKINRIP